MAKKNKKTKVIKSVGWIDKIQNPKWHPLIIFMLGFLLYANTLGHKYTQDDPLVITENMFTTEGVSGISGLLTKDTFFGYFKEAGKNQLVAGGRYRPFSLVMFALEYELFGVNPFIGHLMNIILYGLLGMVLYFFLIALFRHVIAPERLILFSLITTLIYIFHPIHTEAVANIKGRDEILAMLFSLLSWMILLKADKKWFHFMLAGGLFFMAMLSKENPITLAPLFGLGFWMLGHGNIKKSIVVSIPNIVSIIIYLIIRFSILGNTLGSEPLEMMNNPFVKFENGQYAFFTQSERYATILASIGEYVRLLVFPHPLTNDYYPRQMGVMHWSDLQVILSLLIYLVLGGIAAISILKKRAVGFGIIFYLVTISIFSNVLFPIGTHLSERFLFMPSLGFAIMIGFLFNYLYYKKIPYVMPIFVIVLGLYGVKTISRNMVWKDNYTLFTTDVKTSSNSAKALNAAAGSLADASKTIEDESKKQEMLGLAKEYLQKALQIHPNYKNAWLILANVQFYTGNAQKALETYDALLSLDNNYGEAIKNKALVLRYMGREAGEVEQNLPKALRLFKESYNLNAQDWETIRLLGLSEGMMGNHETAIKYFQRFVQMLPNEVAGYVLLSQAFQNHGDLEQAQINRQKALAMDPGAFDKK